jgi:hypothetical protein
MAFLTIRDLKLRASAWLHALQIQFAHCARRVPGAAVRAPVLGARIPRLRSGFRQRARTPAVRLNLGERESEELFCAPSVPGLALSTPI